MSMTREEAIAEKLEQMSPDQFYRFFMKLCNAYLRPVSREQVEKVWRGCEWCNGEHSNNGEISAYTEVGCEGCDSGDNCPNAHSSDDPCYGIVDRALPVNFCPVCGKPRTDEAVQMVMERWKEAVDNG